MNHIVAKSYNPFVPNSYLNRSIIFKWKAYDSVYDNRYQNSIQIPDYHLSRLSFSFLKKYYNHPVDIYFQPRS